MLKVVDIKKDTPDPARTASTVILIREYEQELQVYLLQRSRGSGFFPGSYVFPGGALNPDDREVEFWQKHLDLRPKELLKSFGQGLAIADLIAFGVAAIRETFEEAGVFLGREKNHDNNFLEREVDRPSRGKLDEGWLRRKVSGEGWILSFSNLFPWSHWITPQVMPRRFDTRFFIAFMPEGQDCVPDDQETVLGLWVSPQNGLQGNRQGRIPLSPPTLTTLHELLQFKSLEGLRQEVRHRSWGEPRQPLLLGLEKGAVLVLPWDPRYGKTVENDPGDLKERVLPLGEPFSRLWLNEGIWRPVRIW